MAICPTAYAALVYAGVMWNVLLDVVQLATQPDCRVLA